MFTRKLVLLPVMALVATIFSGCYWVGLPANAHLGLVSGITYVSVANELNEVDVTLTTSETQLLLKDGTVCSWDSVCMANVAQAEGLHDNTALNAIADCEVTWVGTICGQGIYHAAEVAAWGGIPGFNCMVFRATFEGGFVGADPILGIPDSWGTVWTINGFGWNGDGAAVCENV